MIEDRAEVHQATGMVSVQADLPMADALLRLRGRAYATDRPILGLAHDVLNHVANFADEYDDDRP
ncbi:MAG: ANTAR domain-containing protein [Marmoricola sp.]